MIYLFWLHDLCSKKQLDAFPSHFIPTVFLLYFSFTTQAYKVIPVDLKTMVDPWLFI